MSGNHIKSNHNGSTLSNYKYKPTESIFFHKTDVSSAELFNDIGEEADSKSSSGSPDHKSFLSTTLLQRQLFQPASKSIRFSASKDRKILPHLF